MQNGTNAEELHVLKLIASGVCYEDLSDEDKDAYCRYRGFDREGMEAVHAAFAEVKGISPEELHTELERRPTPEECKAMRADVERWVQEEVERFNSPEEVAKREAEYAELQKIGELRRMDFMCGRDPDVCHPLPWQRGNADAS